MFSSTRCHLSFLACFTEGTSPTFWGFFCWANAKATPPKKKTIQPLFLVTLFIFYSERNTTFFLGGTQFLVAFRPNMLCLMTICILFVLAIFLPIGFAYDWWQHLGVSMEVARGHGKIYDIRIYLPVSFFSFSEFLGR